MSEIVPLDRYERHKPPKAKSGPRKRSVSKKSNQRKKASQPKLDREQLEELVEKCRNNDQEAWEKLLEQFNGLIVYTIKSTLRKYHQLDSAQNEKIVDEIYGEFLEKFTKGRVLYNLKTNLALPKVIKRTAASVAIDWIRKQNGETDVFSERRRGRLISLYDPVNSRTDITVGEGIPDDVRGDEISEVEAADLDSVFAEIEKLKPEARLIMKSLYLLHEPLREEDIDLIAETRALNRLKVKEEMRKMVGVLIKKNEKKERAEALAIKYWEEARRTEARLTVLRLDPHASPKSVFAEEARLAKKSLLHEKKLKESRSSVRPSNKQIAHFLGIPGAKAEQISLKVFRIREKLREALEDTDD